MSLPILLYHEIAYRHSVISTPVEVFRSQMAWLKQAGIEVLPLNEIAHRLDDGMLLPRKAVCLTFDDGLAGVYDHAFPILLEFSLPAVLFLVTDYCGLSNNWPGQPDAFRGFPIVNWEQVQEMEAAGIGIGSHSLSHPRLDQLSLPELQHQIRGSKEAIAEHISSPVDWFAYPFGRYSYDVLQVVKSLYQGACTTRLELVRAGSDKHQLGRIEAYYLLNPFAFRLLNSRAFPAYIAIRRLLRTIGGFVYDRPWT